MFTTCEWSVKCLWAPVLRSFALLAKCSFSVSATSFWSLIMLFFFFKDEMVIWGIAFGVYERTD